MKRALTVRNRWLPVAAAACLLAASLLGCAEGAGTTTAATTAGTTAAAAAETTAAATEATTAAAAAAGTTAAQAEGAAGEPYKIGFTYPSFTEILGGQFKSMLEYAGAQLGCEMVFVEWSTTDLEGAVEAHENLIEAGCDGIITVMLTPGMLEAAQQAEIPIVQFGNIISDPEIVGMAEATEYYVGCLSVDDYEAGYDMAQGLYDSGARVWTYVAPPAGQANSHDNRVRGIEQFASEHGDVNLVIGVRESSDKRVDAFRQAVTAYPEIDGVCVTANDNSIIGAIYSDGLEDKIKVAAIDIQEGTDQYLADGTLAWIAGGQAPQTQLAFTMLYNYLSGHNVVTDKMDFILCKFLYITNPDQFLTLEKYLSGEIPIYTGDELKQMCVAFNPAATIDLVKALRDESLEEVMQRTASRGR